MTLFESLAGTRCKNRWDEGSWYAIPLGTEGSPSWLTEDYGLYKAKTKDALLVMPQNGCSVPDTMTVLHFSLLLRGKELKKKP